MILVVGSLTTALVATLPSAAEGAVVAPRFSAIGATPTIPETSPPPAESRQMDDLAPLGSAQPHSHAPLGVDGERPHISGQAGLNLSTNWSGEVDSGAGASFDGVEGDWVVPSVQASATDGFSATWLGIDGVDASSLIQLGTAQNSGPDGLYYAWAEFLPGSEEVIGNTSGPAPVAPGDQMDAQILETSPGVFTITLDDITQDWSFSGPFDYSTPGITAEWIEEDPSSNTGLLPFADYGSTEFTNVAVAGSGLSGAALSPVYMSTDSGAITSYPGAVDVSTDSFPLFYGSPSPQVTSVSPDQGSTSGGTEVTIGGSFVTGVEGVDIGGVSVPFSADVLDGTVTAQSPAHSAGTVDVTVTTPGGVSQPSDSDEFTYVAPVPPPPPPPVTSASSTVSHGYWLVGSDGGIFTFGSAQFYGSTGSLHLQRPVVGIVPTTDRGGYWLDASDGGIFAYGDSGFYGSIPGLGLHPAGSGLPNSLDAPIVGMVPSADGGGYFMVAADGGVFAFGDALFAGSCPGIGGCSGTAVAVMPDASGNGYWLVTNTGHVYTFGDAPFYGAPGPQGVPVTSAVRTPTGKGYWILFADGTIDNYGDAGSFGSPAGLFGGLNPATAIFTTSDGGGYWVASAAGSVDQYGDAPNDGSMAGSRLNGSVIAATGW